MAESKKSTNGTVEQMIEHMTADIQNSDGHYIQIGFTPSSTPNESHIWSEYTQNPIPPNPFVPHYSPRNPDSMGFPIDPSNRFVSQNVAYNNYITQNAIFVPEMPNPAYEKHLNIDIHGNKYVLYPGQNPQYVMTNSDIPMCNYLPVYPENDCTLFANQDIQNLQMPTNVMRQNATSSEQIYMHDNVILHQQDSINMKSKIFLQQNVPSNQNRTHLIENLVGNWTPNTNGTYSPFGNVAQSQQNFFDLKQDISPQQQPQQLADNTPTTDTNDKSLNDFNTKNIKPGIKKQKQIAEVKPMRPTYSDILTKSVPQQNTSKQEKIETKEIKNKAQMGKKSMKNDKFPKLTLNRQVSSNSFESKETQSANNQKFNDKNQSEQKINLSRKWVSLDDVNDTHTKDFLKSDINVETVTSTTKNKKSKKPENAGNSNGKPEKNFSNLNKNNNVKKTFNENNSLGCQWTENDESNDGFKNEEKNINKNSVKKGKDVRVNSARQNRFAERNTDKPPSSAKRNQRIRKKENNSTISILLHNMQHYVSRWLKIVICFLMWLLHLVSDIFTMSLHLGRDFGTSFWASVVLYSKSLSQHTMVVLKKVKIFTKVGTYIDKTFGGYRWAFWNRGDKEKKDGKAEGKTWLNSGLEHNITMPTTGEEAMKRLLACKGKDPYSILGVRPDCTDDDIKRYYKRQAFLVHPDKNPQPGAEEAFKILVHAFDIIGEPERRQSYDRKVAESHQVEQAWSELNDLLSQLHQKMEYAANTIRCTNCTKRHRRISVERPCYAARMCSQCKIHHSAKEGDIWAEASYFGFLWHYYACMDGAVYDITEWAACQRKNLKHLRPNNHNVQYRIVLGKQGGHPGGGGSVSGSGHGRRHKGPGGSASEREADLESFLNNLYNQSDLSNSGAGGTTTHTETNAANAARNRKKNKRKK